MHGTHIGKDLSLSLLPYSNKETVEYLLEETTEAITFLYKKSTPPLSDIPQIDEHLKLVESLSPLSCIQLLDLAKILKTARELKSYFNSDEDVDTSFSNIISEYFFSLYSNLDVEKKIFSSILDESTIDDNASPRLKIIRKKQTNLVSDIKNKLNSILHSSTYSKYLQDNVITLRNDRYVVPVKQEYRSYIKGFVHDISSTGSTVFIEPLSVFELNNDLNSLKIEENIEIEKILHDLSMLFIDITEEIKNSIVFIGKIDFAFAKAKFAFSLNATLPNINDDKIINLIKAKHPLIDKNKVVPIDINIGTDFTTLIITGPNTGGKTVALKTVGLLTLMGMSGLYIPANEHSSIHVFDNVFADIGDEQSIQESLSTFSSHMTNITHIINKSTENSLILLDELGSGTDPIQGSCLAISILEYLHGHGIITFATTHYTELKNFALVTDGFENASSEFNIETLSPTYRIIIGVPGKSMAFDISRKLGLNEDILNAAKSKISSNQVNIEELLKSIYDDKALIEQEKDDILVNSREIEDLKKSLERDNYELKNQETELINNAKLKAKEILLDAKQDADNIIRELTSTSSNKKVNRLRTDLNNKIKNIKLTNSNNQNENEKINPSSISVGLDVFVNSLGQNATTLSLPNKSNMVQVQIGNIKTNVNIDDLSTVTIVKKVENSNYTKKRQNFEIKQISPEINVIGKNVEEASLEVDKYLDTAFLNGLNTVTIVHGKGTGALRKGLHAFLKNHKHVKSFRLGTFGEGEMGVTVIELK